MTHTQRGNTVTVTMTTDEWLAFTNACRMIDSLYTQFFSRGKTPGMMEVPGIWKQIMEAWHRFVQARS
jgi:hypothetical protein